MTRDLGRSIARAATLSVLAALLGACGGSPERAPARGPHVRAASVEIEDPAIIVLVDTSASRAADLADEVARVRSLARSMPANQHLVVAAYDEDVEPIYDGRAADLGSELDAKLARRGTLGTSNAPHAVAWARDTRQPRTDRIVLMTDGVDDGAALDLPGVTDGKTQEGERIETVTIGAATPVEQAQSIGSFAAVLERARPLPDDANDGMSLDPLVEALPEHRKAASEVTVELATDDVGARPAAPRPFGDMTSVSGRLPPETIQTIVRRNFGRFRGCYREAVHHDPRVQGRVVVRFEIGPRGSVQSARAKISEVGSAELTACVVRGFEAIEFPEPPEGAVAVSYPIVFSKTDAGPEPAASLRPAATPPRLPAQRVVKEPRRGVAREVYDALDRGEPARAVERAWAGLRADRSMESFVLLGDAARANGDTALAARAYLSVLDTSPSDVAARAVVAARLLSLGAEHRARAEAYLFRGLAARPNDAATLELLASSRAEAGDLWSALQLLDLGLTPAALRALPGARVEVVRETLRRQMALYAAALAQQRPNDRAVIGRWLADVGAEIAGGPGFTITATFDGGGSDVDLVVRDASLVAASKATPALAAGGALAGDAPASPGVELFALEAPVDHRAYPFEVSVELASGGDPFAAGVVTTATYDGAGRVAIARAPFFLDVVHGAAVVTRLERP